MIPIQHERMAFKYAAIFLKSEIQAIEDSLNYDHLLDITNQLLSKRLSELKRDLDVILKYELHD